MAGRGRRYFDAIRALPVAMSIGTEMCCSRIFHWPSTLCSRSVSRKAAGYLRPKVCFRILGQVVGLPRWMPLFQPGTLSPAVVGDLASGSSGDNSLVAFSAVAPAETSSLS
jgi:hypothetical protein